MAPGRVSVKAKSPEHLGLLGREEGIAAMAVVIGAFSTIAARVLLDLIRFFTNLFFFQALSLADRSPAANTLGAWVIAVPVIGVIATSSTLGSVTRTACTPNASGNVQPVSSYGFFCGSFGAQYW